MQAMSPYHDGFDRNLEMFDPFSLFFWDNFPHDFPFRAPMMRPPLMRPPMMALSLPQLPRMAPVARTQIEYKETPEAHYFMANLPGLRKEDVKVHVEEGKMLHISAKKKHDREENRENYYHVERGYGEFVTRFMLPPNAKPEHLRSHVEDGMLTVVVPKESSGYTGGKPESRRGPRIEDI